MKIAKCLKLFFFKVKLATSIYALKNSDIRKDKMYLYVSASAHMHPI